MKFGGRKCYIQKYKWVKMNYLLKSGYLVRIPEPNDWVWGISSFRSIDNEIAVKEISGKFLGGGISEHYGYEVKLGQNSFWCYNFIYAMRSVYDYLKNKGEITS